MQNFTKIPTVEFDLLQAETQTDGRTDRHEETNSRYRKFANMPRSQSIDPILQQLNKILYVNILRYSRLGHRASRNVCTHLSNYMLPSFETPQYESS